MSETIGGVIPPMTTSFSAAGDIDVPAFRAQVRFLLDQGGLPQFPVALFDHVGDVYRRVETAAGGDFEHVEALRLTPLVHEEPLESLPQLLGSAGVSELLPEVVG